MFYLYIYTVSITVDEDTGYKWTPDGLSVSPKIHNFDDIRMVRITYTWIQQEDDHQEVGNSNRTCEACTCCFGNSEPEDDQNSRPEGDPDIENQTQGEPLLAPAQSTFSEPPPHVLKDLDVTWQGVLTAEASDGTNQARCQIVIPKGIIEHMSVKIW